VSVGRGVSVAIAVGVLVGEGIVGAAIGVAARGTIVVTLGMPTEAEIGLVVGKALAGTVGRVVVEVSGESETILVGVETAGLFSEGAGTGTVAPDPATGSGAVITASAAIATTSEDELAVGVSVGKGVRVRVGKRVIIMESATD